MGLKASLFWLLLLSLLAITWKLFNFPPESEVAVIVGEWLIAYGLVVVFLGATLEAILFVGFYFPGSILIFLSVALAPTPVHAVLSVLVVNAGMITGYSANYLLGKYGWYRVFLKLGMKNGIENAKGKLEENAVRYVFYTYWNPGLAAFTSTAAGIIHLTYKRFLLLMIGALAIWNTFWGILVYTLGEEALSIIKFSLILKIVAIWVVFEILVLLYKSIREHENSTRYEQRRKDNALPEDSEKN